MRSLSAGFVGLLVGILFTMLAINFVLGPRGRSDLPLVPELGGQPVPEQVVEIAFDQRYDIHASIYGVEPMTFPNCKIVGFTGKPDATGARQTRSGSYLSSSSSYRDHFDHWLVLEGADRRLLYLPPNSVKYLEQAAPEKK